MKNVSFAWMGVVASGLFFAGCVECKTPATSIGATDSQEVAAPAAVPVPPATPEEMKRAEMVRREAEITDAKSAAARDPLNWRVFNELGVVYYRQAMFDQAIAAFQQALALHPVTAVIESENRQEAAVAAQRAALEAKRQADIQRAKAMQDQKDMNDLFGMFATVAGANGNANMQALLPVMETLNNASLATPAGVPPLAPEMKMESSLTAKREVAGLYASLGAAYFGKKSYQQAIAALDNVTQLDPSRTEVLKTAAEAQYALCKYDECITTLSKYHAIAPVEPATLLRLADAYRALGMETEAEKAFASFVTRQDGASADGVRCMEIGALCLSHWQYAEALNFLTRAQKDAASSPENASRLIEAQRSQYQMTHALSLMLAEAHCGLLQTTNALPLLREATQDGVNAKAWYMLARCYDEDNEHEKATGAYGKALAAFGGKGSLDSAAHYIQVCRAATGAGDAAVMVLEKQLAGVPLTPGGGVDQWCALAFAFEKAGRMAEAMEILSRCREATPAYTKAGLALERLGEQVATDRNRILTEADAALQSGDKNQAIKKLAEAYRLAAVSQKKEEIRKTLLKLASGMEPSPAMTAEAQDHYLRGNAALKAAKSPTDLGRALSEFQWAIFYSPWAGDLYFNTSAVKKLQNQNAAAVNDLKLYLAAKPAGKNVEEILNRLYEFDYQREQKLRELAAAASF